MTKDLIFIDVAKEYAGMSTAKKRHGAVVVRKGRIIGRGFNKQPMTLRLFLKSI